jgi:hypothetical protein
LTAATSDPDIFERHAYSERVNTGGTKAMYSRAEMRVERIAIPLSAPPAIRVSLEIGKEAAGFWAHIDELDVSGEGESPKDAFSAVVNAARDWLSYVRDEQPALAGDLEAQRAYIALLDAPIFSWFKSFHLQQ